MGFAAGFINSIAGGAGTVVLPVMIWLGIPPVNAIATGKFQAIFGTVVSITRYFHGGFITFRPWVAALIFTALFSALGTLTLMWLPNDFLQWLIPILLLGIAASSLFSPVLNDIERKPRCSMNNFSIGAGSLLGFYAGFWGPGIGPITTLSISSLLGYNARRSVAASKPLVIVANSTSVGLFIAGGKVYWLLALCMGIAQMFGAYLGATIVIRHGAKVIRPAIVLISTLLAAKLLWDAF